MSDVIDDFAYGFRNSQQGETFLLSHSLKVSTKLIRKKTKNENIKLTVDRDEKLSIYGSKSKFIQLIIVLLSNAIEVFQANKQKEPQIRISAEIKDDKTEIDIFNTGAGIPDDVLIHIFDAFFSTKRKDKNTELELTLAKKIIEENLRGTIEAVNRKDGVSFIIHLPVVRSG